MLFSKKLIASLLTGLLLIIFITPVSAAIPDNKTEMESIKSSIQQAFEYRKAQLDLDKKHWGLSESESFKDAILGDGVPYYNFASDLQDKINISNNDFVLVGYIFPIYVGSKPAGVVYVREVKGKFDIVEMSSYLTFDQDIKEAQSQLKADSNTLFLLERGLNIRALVVQEESGMDMIPISDNKELGLVKNRRVPFDSKIEDIRKTINTINEYTRTHPGMVGGGLIQATPDTTSEHMQNQRSYYLAMIAAMIVLVAGVTFISRKNKSMV